eukprot:c22114_g1_i1 orf=140-1444(-)
MEGELCSTASSSSSLVVSGANDSPAAAVSFSCCETDMAGFEESSQHPLWIEIEAGERYLVSAMFEEAALSASSVLCKLCSEISDNNHSRRLSLGFNSLEVTDEIVWDADGYGMPSELDNLTEVAGMLLIQAYNESHRTDEIFEALELYFGCVADVPPSVFLAGVCLQISIGHFSIARLVLESFMQIVSISTTREFSSSMIKQARTRARFAREYTQIAEIYAVQVLTKGLGLAEQALEWVSKADIPGEKKQDIVEKINSYSWPCNDSQTSSQNKLNNIPIDAHSVTSGSMKRNIVSEGEDHCGDMIKGMDYSVNTHMKGEPVSYPFIWKALHLFSPVVMISSKAIASSTPYLPSFALRLRALLAFLLQKKFIGGAVTFFFTYAMYKQRHSLRRFIWDLLYAVYVGLAELWQLAFNVQLNPLAAVQPLPPVNYASM